MWIRTFSRLSVFFVAFAFSISAWSIDGPTLKLRRECRKEQFQKFSSLAGEVSKIVDGDTIGFLYRGGDYRIRMVGIDTAETHFQGKSQGYWGDVAHDRLSQVLPLGASVKILLSGEKCDHFGRILGEVIYEKENLNNRMLAEGLAVNYCIWPDDGCLEKSDLVRPNTENRRGIFSGAPAVELPYIWRDQMRGTAPHRYLGSLRSHEVYPPGSFDKVPAADRVFFNLKKDVAPPYFFVE